MAQQDILFSFAESSLLDIFAFSFYCCFVVSLYNCFLKVLEEKEIMRFFVGKWNDCFWS